MTKENWTIRFGIWDGSIFAPPNVNPIFLVLVHDDVEGGLWASL
jgi:hypothetical protein